MGSWGHGLLGSDMGSWGQTWEAVQEFPVEIHKSLPSNGLRISSLIKVVSLLARTYGKKRRILGQPPRATMKIQRSLPESMVRIIWIPTCPNDREDRHRSGKVPDGRRTTIGVTPRAWETMEDVRSCFTAWMIQFASRESKWRATAAAERLILIIVTLSHRLEGKAGHSVPSEGIPLHGRDSFVSCWLLSCFTPPNLWMTKKK